MSENAEPMVTLPVRIDDLIKIVCEKAQACRKWRDSLGKHVDNYPYDVEEEAIRFQYTPNELERYLHIGQEIVEEAAKADNELIEASQNLAAAYDALSIPF